MIKRLDITENIAIIIRYNFVFWPIRSKLFQRVDKFSKAKKRILGENIINKNCHKNLTMYNKILQSRRIVEDAIWIKNKREKTQMKLKNTPRGWWSYGKGIYRFTYTNILFIIWKHKNYQLTNQTQFNI